MAIEYCDSFSTYTTAQIGRRYTSASSVDIATPGPDGSTGAYARNAGATGGTFTVNVTARSEYFVGFDLRCDGNFNHTPDVVTFKTAANVTICNIQNASGFLTTFGNTATGLMALGTWYHIVIYIKRHASAGILTIRIDGVTVLNLTGLNTGATDISKIVMSVGTDGGTHIGQIGNLWILNTTGSHSNTFPVGRMKVKPLYPNADGTYTSWTPNSGTTHYDRVNNTTADDDTTYNSSLTVSAKDSYSCTDLATSGIAHVHALQITATVRKDDVDPKNYQIFSKSGATETFSSDIAATVPYAQTSIDGVVQLMHTDDPNTSAEWTVTNANLIEVGVKVTL